MILFDDISLLHALSSLNERRTLPENCESEIAYRKIRKMSYLKLLKKGADKPYLQMALEGNVA